MLGESLEKYVEDNKKTRRQKALECLDLLRGYTDEDVKENARVFLEALSLLVELINDKDPYDQITLEEIDSSPEEVRGFEEKSLLVEDAKCSVSTSSISSINK